DGRAVESGSLTELRHLHRTRVSADLDAAAAHGLERAAGVHDVTYVDGRWSAHVEEAAMPGVLGRLADLGVTGFTASPPTLEELFLSHYEKA
ncbi:MAG: DUF4162 domain-containing protein, partial [Propionibacteriaceae bacterium]|nr:DUF4162 domain-containing protein [Propionibacteriaceae bacterium]